MNTGTGIYAIHTICTHRGCRLSDGTPEGGNVHCPCHGSVFRAKTGEVIQGHVKTTEPASAVTIKNSGITVSP